jgi:hypothetical protein
VLVAVKEEVVIAAAFKTDIINDFSCVFALEFRLYFSVRDKSYNVFHEVAEVRGYTSR